SNETRRDRHFHEESFGGCCRARARLGEKKTINAPAGNGPLLNGVPASIVRERECADVIWLSCDVRPPAALALSFTTCGAPDAVSADRDRVGCAACDPSLRHIRRVSPFGRRPGGRPARSARVRAG